MAVALLRVRSRRASVPVRVRVIGGGVGRGVDDGEAGVEVDVDGAAVVAGDLDLVGAFLAAVGALVGAVISDQLASSLDNQLAFLFATALLGIVGIMRYRSLVRAPADYLAQLGVLKLLKRLRR